MCIRDRDKETGELLFDPEVGCNQGGEGCVRFAQWWIENVMEELGTHLQQHRSSRHLHFAGLTSPLLVCLQTTDAPEEWFFNETEKKLCEQHASEANPHVRTCQAWP